MKLKGKQFESISLVKGEKPLKPVLVLNKRVNWISFTFSFTFQPTTDNCQPGGVRNDSRRTVWWRKHAVKALAASAETRCEAVRSKGFCRIPSVVQTPNRLSIEAESQPEGVRRLCKLHLICLWFANSGVKRGSPSMTQHAAVDPFCRADFCTFCLRTLFLLPPEFWQQEKMQTNPKPEPWC